jgi:hypothetical protein
VQVDYFKSEADDPQHESPQSRLVWQVGAESCRSRTFGHRAVVECRAQRIARAADEGDLIRAGSEMRDVGRLRPPPVQIRCRVRGTGWDRAGAGRGTQQPGTPDQLARQPSRDTNACDSSRLS